jgi:hypothetical protein
VLVVNEVISRSLECVGAEVQFRGVDARSQVNKSADERIEDLCTDGIRKEIWKVENDE